MASRRAVVGSMAMVMMAASAGAWPHRHKQPVEDSVPSNVSAADAHKYADGILYPELIAAMNDFAYHHGALGDKGHLETLNAQDAERVQRVRTAFKAWSEEMERAGYEK